MSWLDNNGVSYLWGKMKAWVQNQGYASTSDLPPLTVQSEKLCITYQEEVSGNANANSN